MADHQPDAVLATEARNGNRQAFDELVVRHKTQIYRLARHYAGNDADALDIVQDAFVAAWLALPRYDAGRDLGAWLRTITLNKCRDFSRRRAVRRNVLRLFARLDVRETAVPGADAAAERTENEALRLQALDAAIAQLPGLQKEALILTAFAGLSHQEAADQLGLTVKAVEMKVRRAKLTLEAVLAARDAPDKRVP